MRVKDPTKVGFFEKLVFGSGDVGINAMYTLFSTYVLFFYTDVIGLNAGIMGTVILVSKILDGLSDLVAGYLIDKNKGKRGHSIPVLLKWTIPMVISVVLVFTVPNAPTAWRIAYVFATYNLFNTVMYTYVSVAHASLATYVTDNARDQGHMLIYKMMFAALTQTIMANVMIPMVESFGGQFVQLAWIKAILVFGAVGAFFMFLNVAFVKERVDNPAPAENILKGVVVALKNKYWIIALIIGICANLCLIFNLTVSVYYLDKVVGNMALMGSWVAVCNIPGIPLALVTPFLLKIKGMNMRKLLLIGGTLMLIGQVIFIMSPADSVSALLISGLIKGIGFSFPIGMSNALIAETIDYGEWKTGTRVQGVLLSAGGVGNKIGQGLMTGLFGVFLSAIGYDGTLAAQAAHTLTGIDAFFKFGPLVVILIILVAAFFFKVEDINPQIQKELAERREIPEV